jgi:hypothetical protein
MYPTEEIEDEAAGVTIQPKQPDLSMVGQVYKMPDGRIGQITPKVNGRFGVNFL